MSNNIPELIEQLETAGQGWVAAARRDVALRALRAAASQDLGTEPAAWRAWWAGRQDAGAGSPAEPPAAGAASPAASEAPRSGPAPRSAVELVLSPKQGLARDFLQRTGLYEHDAFEAAVSFKSVDFDGDLDAALGLYLIKNGPDFHLPSLRHGGHREAESLRRMLGVPVTLEVGSEGRARLRIDGQVTVLDDLARGLVEAVAGFCWTRLPDRSVMVDTSGRLWLVTAAAAAELRQRRLVRFLQLHPERPGGEIPPLVEAALARLRTLGAGLELDPSTLALGVAEALAPDGSLASGEAALRATLLQLLALDGAGLLIEQDLEELRPPSAAEIAGALQRLLGVALLVPELEVRRARSAGRGPKGSNPPPVHRLSELAAAVDRQLEERARRAGGAPSPKTLRLVAVEDPEGTPYGRLIAVPAGWLPALLPEGDASRATAVTTLRLPRAPLRQERLDPWAPAGTSAVPGAPVDLRRLRALPKLTFDAETVDEPEDYEGLVSQLLALARGHLDVESIKCTEQDGCRRLVLRSGQERWHARLEADTDWVDLDPLLECLNQLALDRGGARSYWRLDLPGAGQEATVVFASEEETRGLPRWQPSLRPRR